MFWGTPAVGRNPFGRPRRLQRPSETAGRPNHKPWDQQFQTFNAFLDVEVQLPIAWLRRRWCDMWMPTGGKFSFLYICFLRFQISTWFKHFNLTSPKAQKQKVQYEVQDASHLATFLFTTSDRTFLGAGCAKQHWSSLEGATLSWIFLAKWKSSLLLLKHETSQHLTENLRNLMNFPHVPHLA